MSQPRIAMILYTVREPAREDLDDTLRRVRECGFKYVQWSGMPNMPADKIRAALEKADLEAVAAHISVEEFENHFDESVAFWETVGVRNIGPGGMMQGCWESHDMWLEGAKRLETLGAKLRDAGIRLSYHNHAAEFEKFEGDNLTKLDLLYQNTRPDCLHAELDVAWIHVGGADPAAYLRKYKDRCPLIHVKDVEAERDANGNLRWMPLGQGVIDWPEVLEAGRQANVEWMIYEQDTYEGDLWDCVRASYKFMKKHLG